MKVINIDRLVSYVFGGTPSKHDRAIVLSETETVPHIITGKLQPRCLFRGTLSECYIFIDTHKTEDK